MLGFGLSLTQPAIPASGAVAWTPASLGAQLKGWWDISDISTLFQLSNGTTAVSANNDPIGYVADKSGVGSHLIQATAGLRPLYNTATLPKATFDGAADKVLATAADVALADGAGQWFCALAFRYATLGANLILCTYDSGTTPMGTPFANAAGAVVSRMRRADTSLIVDTNTTQPGTVQPAVLFTQVVSTSGGQIELFVDGVSDGATTGGTGLITGAAKVAIGDYPANGTPQGGDLYAGVIGVGAISSADRASLVTYLGSKCGRTL